MGLGQGSGFNSPTAFAQEPFTIGISNGFVGSEWRSQMVEDLEQVNAEYMDEGLTNELVVQSQSVDVQGQIQQIRNLINRGVDALIINPNSQSGLNQVIADAAAAGIVVIAVDQQVSAPQAVNVVIPQAEWARMSARWVAQHMDGEGDLIVVNGLAGHPANEARWAGAQEVFDAFEGINILNVINAGWDEATGQQKVSNLLASQPDVDAIWSQDGMAAGALRAVRAAELDSFPVIAGEARVGYMRLWQEIQENENPDFTSYGVINPPGIGASGLRIAVEMLKGRELKDGILSGPFDNSIFFNIAGTVNKVNFPTEMAKVTDRPDPFALDSIMTRTDADAHFKS